MSGKRFSEIATKLRRIERMMNGLAADAERKAVLFGEAGAVGPSSDMRSKSTDAIPKFDRASLARLLLKLKDCRLNHIENDMFSNVSWDMLLTLYVEEMATGGPVLTKAVILGAGCAQSTGSRWIGHLEEQGLIRRFGASEDQRARMVEITDQGVEIMDDYLEAAGAVIYEAWIDMQVESAVELDSMH